MKHLIAGAAILILLLTFITQYAVENTNNMKYIKIDKYVKTAKEKAKGDGYFTADNINELKTNILNVCTDLTESELVIEVDTTPKYRTNEFDERELIKYKIGVPIKRIIASNSFFNISDADNSYVYYSEGTITSELIKP